MNIEHIQIGSRIYDHSLKVVVVINNIDKEPTELIEFGDSRKVRFATGIPHTKQGTQLDGIQTLSFQEINGTYMREGCTIISNTVSRID